MLYDRIAVEKHIYTATRAERIQDSKHWILTINAEGRTQQSLNQGPDFAQARRERKRLHRQHGIKPHWKTSKWNSQHSSCLRTSEFFSELGQVSVAWRNTSSQTTGGCEQYTHKYSTCRVAQHDHISSREHAWLKSCKAQDCTFCIQLSSTCHVSSFAAPDTDHHLSDVLAFAIKPCDSRPVHTLRCSTAEGGSTQHQNVLPESLVC